MTQTNQDWHGARKFFQFERLDVWKMSIDWANQVMALSEGIPQKYRFSLGEQLRRAALSVPTNIAEGTGRQDDKEKKTFLQYRQSFCLRSHQPIGHVWQARINHKGSVQIALQRCTQHRFNANRSLKCKTK